MIVSPRTLQTGGNLGPTASLLFKAECIGGKPVLEEYCRRYGDQLSIEIGGRGFGCAGRPSRKANSTENTKRTYIYLVYARGTKTVYSLHARCVTKEPLSEAICSQARHPEGG